MLAPRLHAFPFPEGAPDSDPPPPEYKRPVLNRHLGYITHDHQSKMRSAGAKMGVMQKYIEEMGNPVVIRPQGSNMGYDTVDATANHEVSTDNVLYLRRLQKKAALDAEVASMLDEYNQKDTDT